MKYQTIFWDWNGTIIDDLHICMQSINTLLKRRSMKLFEKPQDYFDVFCFPIIEYYRKIGFDYTKEPYIDLANEYMIEYDKNSKNAKPFNDVIAAIKSLNQLNMRQIVLSAYEKNALVEWLKVFKIYNYFDDVIGLDNIYAAGKVDIALRWLENNKIDLSKAVMIGDTTHDCEVAEAMGCDCILLARGHNSEADLRSTGKKVFNKASELLTYLLLD
ncbi:MAG: HAD hydrolase-like protein [Clostridia bacterium]